MQLLQCCPVCRESCGENDLRKNIILQQLTDHLELLPARICARLAHPSGDKSAAENLRRKDPTFKAASTIAKHISGGARACCMGSKHMHACYACAHTIHPGRPQRHAHEREICGVCANVQICACVHVRAAGMWAHVRGVAAVLDGMRARGRWGVGWQARETTI